MTDTKRTRQDRPDASDREIRRGFNNRTRYSKHDRPPPSSGHSISNRRPTAQRQENFSRRAAVSAEQRQGRGRKLHPVFTLRTLRLCVKSGLAAPSSAELIRIDHPLGHPNFNRRPTAQRQENFSRRSAVSAEQRQGRKRRLHSANPAPLREICLGGLALSPPHPNRQRQCQPDAAAVQRDGLA